MLVKLDNIFRTIIRPYNFRSYEKILKFDKMAELKKIAVFDIDFLIYIFYPNNNILGHSMRNKVQHLKNVFKVSTILTGLSKL